MFEQQKCCRRLLYSVNIAVKTFNNLRKQTGHNFFQYCWMNVWRSLIAHIYSVASITTRFTPKVRTRLLIPRTRRRIFSCGDRRHSSRIAFVNAAIFWLYEIRWFTLQQIQSHLCTIGFISGDMAGLWNVSIDSWCLKSLAIRAMCDQAISSINTGLSANGWLSKG